MQPPSGQTRPSFGDFLTREHGNVATIFGLAFVPLVLMVGVGIDYGRIVAARSNLQQASDSAVLAVAKNITTSTTNQQAQSQAQVYLATNIRSSTATVTSATISTDRLSVCVNSQIQLPTTVMKIARVNTMTAQALACASLPGGLHPNDTYEIALVLDNSGSMTRSTNRQSKLDALKTAATSFVSTMFTKAPSRVKMSITPFSSGVIPVDPTLAANRTLSWIDTSGVSSEHWVAFGGKTAANALGFTSRLDIFTKLKQLDSTWDWGGCFEPQPYPLNVDETVPTSATADSLFVPFLAPDEPDNPDSSRATYSMDYLPDNGGACSGSVSGDWANITNVCKYKVSSRSSTHNGYGPNGLCPDYSTETVLQLTSSQTTINAKLSNLVANGDTNLHEGLMWGWRTISPNAPFSAGRAYDKSNSATNHKVIVFMTDGFNNWSSSTRTAGGSLYEALGYYSYNGSKNKKLPDGRTGDGVDYQTQLAAAGPNVRTDYQPTSRDAQDEMTLEACINAKAKGIEIYTIGFSIASDPIDAQGLTLLQSCATNASHYFAATDASSLNAAFSTIGTGLGALRLSQ